MRRWGQKKDTRGYGCPYICKTKLQKYNSAERLRAADVSPYGGGANMGIQKYSSAAGLREADCLPYEIVVGAEDGGRLQAGDR